MPNGSTRDIREVEKSEGVFWGFSGGVVDLAVAAVLF
jgi:hypothetical protein